MAKAKLGEVICIALLTPSKLAAEEAFGVSVGYKGCTRIRKVIAISAKVIIDPNPTKPANRL